MYKLVNHEYIPMTEQEEREYLRQQAEQEEYDRLHPATPTPEERIAELERLLYDKI